MGLFRCGNNYPKVPRCLEYGASRQTGSGKTTEMGNGAAQLKKGHLSTGVAKLSPFLDVWWKGEHGASGTNIHGQLRQAPLFLLLQLLSVDRGDKG